MFNWGIIGPGHIAHKFAKGMSEIEDARIYAVASHSLDKAKSFAEKYGAEKTFTDYKQLADCKEIDAVYISTINPYHHEPAIICLEAGKAVLCEKPLALNAKFAKQMMDKAADKNTFLMEAMWTRFLPAVTQIKSWLKEGLIGDIRMVRADFCVAFEFDPNGRWFNKVQGGGALLDLGVYPISFVTMILGNGYKEIFSVGSLVPTGVDEHSAIILKYSNGAIAQISSSFTVNPPPIAYIAGTEGYIEVPRFWRAESAKLVRHDGKELSCSFDYDETAFKFEALEVQKCVEAGKNQSDIMPWEDSLRVMEIIDTVKENMGLKYEQE